MGRRIIKTKRDSGSFLILLLLGLVVASFFVVFGRAPEHVVGVSSDRMVSVEGVSHEATSVRILRFTHVEQSIPRMRGPVYEVVVQGGGVLETSTVQYRIPTSLRTAPSQTWTLIVFDPATLSWKPVATTIDEKTFVASATLPIHQTMMIGLGTTF